MNESEQAQAIAEIRKRYEFFREGGFSESEDEEETIVMGFKLLKIVDSQAQKIAQLTKERDEMTAAAYRLGSEAQQHISEARKIAEKMRDASERPGGGHTFLPWEKK